MSEGEGAAAAAVDAVEARAASTCCCCCCGGGGGGGPEDSLERLCAKCRQRLLDEAKLAHPRPLTAADISKRAHVPLHKLQLLLNEEEQQHTPPALKSAWTSVDGCERDQVVIFSSTRSQHLDYLQHQITQLEQHLETQKVALRNKEHIYWLHRYNETKDMACMMFGKIAECEGVAVRELYERYGLDDRD